MNKFMDTLCAQVDILIKICESLQQCLEVERTALISLQLDAILENNVKKDAAIAIFVEEKKNLRVLLKEHLHVQQLPDVAACLSGPDADQWKIKWAEWESVWIHTRKLCVRNRDFLHFSQKNLDAVHQNLLDLFGQKATYDVHGNKIKKSPTGQVMEAKA